MVTRLGFKVPIIKQTKNERFDQVRNFDLGSGSISQENQLRVFSQIANLWGLVNS